MNFPLSFIHSVNLNSSKGLSSEDLDQINWECDKTVQKFALKDLACYLQSYGFEEHYEEILNNIFGPKFETARKSGKGIGNWSVMDVSKWIQTLNCLSPMTWKISAIIEDQWIDGELFMSMDEKIASELGIENKYYLLLNCIRQGWIHGWTEVMRCPSGVPPSVVVGIRANLTGCSSEEIQKICEADDEASYSGIGSVYGQFVVLGSKEYRFEGGSWQPSGIQNEKFVMRRRKIPNGLKERTILTPPSSIPSSFSLPPDRPNRSFLPLIDASSSDGAHGMNEEKEREGREKEKEEEREGFREGDSGGEGGCEFTLDLGEGEGGRLRVVYSRDNTKDYFQIGRQEDPSLNDYIVHGHLHLDPHGGLLSSPISRFACRIECERLPPHRCFVYAAGFNEKKEIFLSEKAPKWSMDPALLASSFSSSPSAPYVDAFTSLGIKLFHPVLREWGEVSVRGNLYPLRGSTKDRESRVRGEGERKGGGEIHLGGDSLPRYVQSQPSLLPRTTPSLPPPTTAPSTFASSLASLFPSINTFATSPFIHPLLSVASPSTPSSPPPPTPSSTPSHLTTSFFSPSLTNPFIPSLPSTHFQPQSTPPLPLSPNTPQHQTQSQSTASTNNHPSLTLNLPAHSYSHPVPLPLPFSNELLDGSLLDLGGVTLLFQKPQSMKKRPLVEHRDYISKLNALRPQCPVQLTPLEFSFLDSKERALRALRRLETQGRGYLPSLGASMLSMSVPSTDYSHLEEESRSYVYVNCGHISGYHKSLEGKPCPLCRKMGPFVPLAFAFEPSICPRPPTHVFSPCGHVASREVCEYWSQTPLLSFKSSSSSNSNLQGGQNRGAGGLGGGGGGVGFSFTGSAWTTSSPSTSTPPSSQSTPTLSASNLHLTPPPVLSPCCPFCLVPLTAPGTVFNAPNQPMHRRNQNMGNGGGSGVPFSKLILQTESGEAWESAAIGIQLEEPVEEQRQNQRGESGKSQTSMQLSFSELIKVSGSSEGDDALHFSSSIPVSKVQNVSEFNIQQEIELKKPRDGCGNLEYPKYIPTQM